jgi:hypothetical protein
VALVKTDVSKECITSNIRLVFIHSVLQLQVTGNVVPSSLILFTIMMEAIPFSETLVLTRAKWRNFPEDSFLKTVLKI